MAPVGSGLPIWFQVLLGVVGVLGFLGGALAFLLVIWPSIRRQNRMADRIERALESEEAKALLGLLRERLLSAGPEVSREEFLRAGGGKP